MLALLDALRLERLFYDITHQANPTFTRDENRFASFHPLRRFFLPGTVIRLFEPSPTDSSRRE